jgi:DNA-binding Lrp family transcriptional regulator
VVIVPPGLVSGLVWGSLCGQTRHRRSNLSSSGPDPADHDEVRGNPVEPLTLDELDRQLVHALQIDGRASFGRIAEILGASDRTVARRYRRLRSTGALRVVGTVDARAHGLVDWIVRMQCDPATATVLAATLAQRDDTSWVGLASGGTEVTCVTRAASRPHGENLVLQKLPRTPRITAVAAQCLLRQLAGTSGWHGRTSALEPGQIAALRGRPADADEQGATVESGPAVIDRHLLAVLAKDGRATHPVLAAATGWSESTVRRRLDQLRRSGALLFEVEIDPLLFGATCEAVLWMTVAPAALATVAAALARHEDIAFAAATSGATNVVAFAVCRDLDGLYDYLATVLGALPGVERVETSPVGRHVKRAGTLVMPGHAPV